MAYYPVKRIYLDTKQKREWPEYADFDRVEIRDYPQRTNGSHEIRTRGWLGTTNQVAEHALGEFGTLAEAEAAVQAHLAESGYRRRTPGDCPGDGDLFAYITDPGDGDVETRQIPVIYWIGDEAPVAEDA